VKGPQGITTGEKTQETVFLLKRGGGRLRGSRKAGFGRSKLEKEKQILKRKLKNRTRSKKNNKRAGKKRSICWGRRPPERIFDQNAYEKVGSYLGGGCPEKGFEWGKVTQLGRKQVCWCWGGVLGEG